MFFWWLRFICVNSSQFQNETWEYLPYKSAVCQSHRLINHKKEEFAIKVVLFNRYWYLDQQQYWELWVNVALSFCHVLKRIIYLVFSQGLFLYTVDAGFIFNVIYVKQNRYYENILSRNYMWNVNINYIWEYISKINLFYNYFLYPKMWIFLHN